MAGSRIPDLSVERVPEWPADELYPKVIRQLSAAREYLVGLSPDDVKEEYGWGHQTVYSWLDCFEEGSFEDALNDDERPGRLSELSEKKFQQFAETLNQSLEEARYDKPASTSPLVQQYLITEFDVARSLRHVQRLMEATGVSSKRPRSEPVAVFK